MHNALCGQDKLNMKMTSPMIWLGLSLDFLAWVLTDDSWWWDSRLRVWSPPANCQGEQSVFLKCISQQYFSTVFLNCIFELIRRRQVPGATRRGVGGANLTKASEPRCDCSSDSFGRLTTPRFRQHCSCSHSALDREENLQRTNFLAPNDGSAGNVRGWTSVLLAYFCLGCFFGHKPIDYQPKWSSISAWVLYSSRF